MLTQFIKILITIAPLALLMGCTSSTPDDEKYGIIQGNFPSLADVPDRPKAPNQKDLDIKVKKLEQDRSEASDLVAKNQAMIKK